MKSTLIIQHHQDDDWKRELEFYVDELAILTSRLSEYIGHNGRQKTQVKAAQFENEFIKLREQIDTLAHDIKIRERKVENKAINEPDHVDEEVKTANDKMLEKMMALGGKMVTTRYEFNRFIAKAIL